MSLSRHSRKLSHRSRRPSLLVEQLEKRELLSAVPLNAPAQPPSPTPYAAALIGPFATMPAAAQFPGEALPGTSGQPSGNLPAGAWQGPLQTPSTPAAQKPPANRNAVLAELPLVVGPLQSSSPAGEGYTPAQMRQAYGFNQIALPAGQSFDQAGSGQTIAIIDILDDPYIVSDVQTFDKTFNIAGAANNPASTSFLKVVNETGGSALPDTDQGQAGYGLETSLDVEWAHAMAPGANILLVEASSPYSNDLDTAIEFAARQPGVSVVSMSLGLGDWPTELYLDNLFTTPSGHQGVSFVASAGDGGGTYANYPAISPNVLSVGGTTLPPDASGNPNRTVESAWTDGGGGVSYTEAEPAYQLGVQSTGFRTGPDLAYDADINTGVAVYDTLLANAVAPGEPWFQVGGTSMGAPQISSMVAIADQLRVAAHEATLDGPNQLLPAVYQIAATDPNAFQDVTRGNNGFAAGPGYDFATGLGTPNAQYFVADLAAVDPTPPAPTTLYWTGDVSPNWDTPGNWSTVDPLVKNVPQSVLPAFNNDVVVDLVGATILHDTTNYDTVRSFKVTAANVSLDLGAATLDLSGGGGRGTFQVDQPGDVVTMEGGVLVDAVVTGNTTLSATSEQDYGQYPDLVHVQVDGTINANLSGGDNGLQFTNGLVLNGTINLGGNSDESSVLLAGYADPYVGNLDNNPETISGTGTIQLGQSQDGDAIYNWGTYGTFTIGPGITVKGGGPGSTAVFAQTNDTGGLDNQGTIEDNGGTLVIAGSPFESNGGAPATTGWTNEGTIEATGVTLGLLGNWTNYGTIRADSTSTVFLGSPTNGDVPTSPDAPDEAWSSQGSLTIGNGATVYAGGFLTTDEYLGAASIPGVTVNPSRDTFFLDGTLDNSPADNPASKGVLALNAGTGPLEMIGGSVNGGSIRTSGIDDVEVSAAAPLPDIEVADYDLGVSAAGGWLYDVANDGTVNATEYTHLTLQNVTNNGTINGTGAVVDFVDTWANHGTIRVDAASSLHLGTTAFNGPTFPPTLANGSAYAWNFNAVGTIVVANGATVAFGGLLTSDQFAAFPRLPGVSVNLAQDTTVLDGWLDNTPADNPVHGGVLSLNTATGPVDNNGFISGGVITTTGTGILTVAATGILDSVTNDGVIAVSEDAELLMEGAVVNNGTLSNANGRIYNFDQSSVTNNASITVTAGGYDGLGPTVTNNGTITLTDGGLVVVPGNAAGSPPATFTNRGIISLSYGYLYLQSSTTNFGTVSGSTHSGVTLNGAYDNSHGVITVDATSGLYLGYTTLEEANFPTLADGAPYAYNPNDVGTLKVADGAVFALGGLLTTDQWNAFPSLPGVSLHPTKDTVFLIGWLDNSPADNRKSHGVLALSAATGPLDLDGGYIYQGKITTSGANDLEGADIGILDGVELDGNLNVTGPYGFGEIYVVNNLKLTGGTIEVPGGNGSLLVGYFDNAADTISGTGTISLGTAQTYEADLVDLSDNSLTIGSGITINAGAQYADLVSEVSQINVEGTVEDNTASSTLYSYGQARTTNNELFQDLANFNSGTLTGGSWEFSNGATWRLEGADLTTNAANLSLSGAGTQVLDAIFTLGANALAGLATNTAAGRFTVGTGYDFMGTGTFTNAGVVNIQGGGSFSMQGNYTQTGGGALDVGIAGPSAYGQLAVSGTATLAGTLNVAVAAGYSPAAGAWFPILTFGGRAGEFAAETGLTLSKTQFLLPSYLGNELVLVLGPGVSVVAGTDLFIIGGLTSNDQVQVSPIGSSNTGSTGVQVTATMNGTSATTNWAQGFTAIYVTGFAGNDVVKLEATLTISANISLGNGNDIVTVGNGAAGITLGNGNDVVVAGDGANALTLGNGNDVVAARNGNNTITLGNGNDVTAAGNGSNVVVEGNGNDGIAVGNGNNLIVAGLGQHAVLAGNGSNILIDGAVKLTQAGDSLRQVLNDWVRYGAQAANVAGIRARLAVTENSSHANVLVAGGGLDWFWEAYAKDVTNRKGTDLLN